MFSPNLTGLNPEETVKQLNDFCEYGANVYNQIISVIKELTDSLYEAWWSPNVVDFNKTIHRDVIPTADELITAYRDMALRAQDAANDLRKGNGLPEKTISNIALLKSGFDVVNLLEARSDGVVGIKKPEALEAKDKFTNSVEEIKIKIEQTPKDISFYNPGDTLMNIYKANLDKCAAKLNAKFDEVSSLINQAINNEAEVAERQSANAAQSLNG